MLWFTNLKTANKLLVFFAAMLAFLVVTAAMGASAARTMKEQQRATYERDLRSIAYLERLTGQRLRIARSVRDGIIEIDATRMAAHARETANLEQSLRRSFADLEKEVGDPAVHAVVRALAADFDAYMAKAREAVAASPSETSKGDYPKMMAALEEMTRIGRASDVAISAQVERLTAEAAARAADAEALYRRDVAISAGLFVAVVLFGSACTAVISRAIATPLKAAVVVLEKVADGDLTAELEAERRDEIGQMARALNRSIAAMRATLVDVTEISREVALASGELASSAQTISSGAQEQASSLEETAASLEEISVVVKQNTESTQRVADVTADARDSAGRGGSVVESAVTAMEDITRSSKQVADIISTIDEIAFQTNLLALNAAVEAARAGEQGRGFAVVATEVRMLAQRTGGAAREIRGLIAESATKVEAGTRQVNESGRTLADLVRAVRTVTDMVGEIAAASREQTASVDQVAQSVSQVDQVTQQNAAQTEELSATATALADKAAHLQRLVGAFQLGDGAPPGAARLAAVRRLPQHPAAKAAAGGLARAANG